MEQTYLVKVTTAASVGEKGNEDALLGALEYALSKLGVYAYTSEKVPVAPEGYNGWKNYATWRVNMEIIDGVNFEESGEKYKDVHDLALAIKENAKLYLDDESGAEVAKSYALSFLEEVDWREIAEHMAADFPSIMKS